MKNRIRHFFNETLKTKHIIIICLAALFCLIVANYFLLQENVVISKVIQRGCNLKFLVENKTQDSLKAIITANIASVNYKGMTRDVGGETFPIILTPREKKTIQKDIQCVHPGNRYDIRVIETSIFDTGSEGKFIGE